jgi:hypothetical protein
LHRTLRLLTLVAASVFSGGLASAFAQATHTATRLIDPAIFVGTTGVYTGLGSGRNLSVTAGIDLAFCPVRKLEPALEYRGMYAIDKGQIDSLKSNLGGLKLSTYYARLHPYADLLVGRGETAYANGGYRVPSKLIFYTQSSSNVFSLGGGTDVLAGDHFALKIDLQIQRYSSPVTPSGHLYSEIGTIGLVYTLHLGGAAH